MVTTLTRTKYTSFSFKCKTQAILVVVNYRIKGDLSFASRNFDLVNWIERERGREKREMKVVSSIMKNAVADRVPYIFMGTVYGFYSLHINYIVKDSPGAAR